MDARDTYKVLCPQCIHVYKHCIGAIVTVAIICGIFGCHRDRQGVGVRGNGSDYHIVKLGETYEQLITDPYRWSLEQFADGPLDDSDWVGCVEKHGLAEAQADIDFDASPELLIRQDVPARAWTYLAFRQIEGGYRYLGCFDAGYFKILPLDEQGRPQIVAFEPVGGHHCRILKFTHHSSAFALDVIDEFNCGDGTPDEKNRRLEELFGGFEKGIEFHKVQYERAS